MEITIRPATEADIEGILDIVNGYAAQNLMLPRTDEQIRRVLRWFLVAEAAGPVVGCGSNVELTPQLTELRSLAVAPEYRGTGLGKRLVEALVARARSDGYDQICALTLSEGFFNRLRLRHGRSLGHLAEDLARVHLLSEVRRVRRDRRADEPDRDRSPRRSRLRPRSSMEMWQGVDRLGLGLTG